MKVYILLTVLLFSQGILYAQANFIQINSQKESSSSSSYVSSSSATWDTTTKCFDELCNWGGYFNSMYQQLLNEISQTEGCNNFANDYIEYLENPSKYNSESFPVKNLQKCVDAGEDNLTRKQSMMAECYCECGQTNCYNGQSVSVASYLACEREICQTQNKLTTSQYEKISKCVNEEQKCQKTKQIFFALYGTDQDIDIDILYTDLPLKEQTECISLCFDSAGVSADCSLSCTDNSKGDVISISFIVLGCIFAFLL